MGAEIPNSFVAAIHQVETKGRFGHIVGKANEYGPLQITYKCWKDSGIKGKFDDCFEYDYSVIVLKSYLNKYGSSYIKDENWGALARIWNGGPDGCKKRETLEYAKKVLKILDADKNKE